MTYSRQCNVPELLVQILPAYIPNINLTFKNAIVVTNLDPLDLHDTVTYQRLHIKYQYKQIYM